ncbi:MAG: radical SAM protein [Candidatus Aminicenantes bacterium]|nr:radical SAM protein [Candidatus Aminicenantes bacterium]
MAKKNPVPKYEAAYLKTYRRDLLKEKIEKAFQILENCTLCPRSCKVNRLRGEKGVCQAGLEPEVSSYSPHFSEETPLVGRHGSGTIFFAHCSLRCSFCQNYSISHLGEGQAVSYKRLAGMMVELQSLGCHNINFVSPSHYVPQILKSLPPAIEAGLSVPLVYNTGGYDALGTLSLLKGVIDIYMPDFKFSQSGPAEELCHAPDYPQAAKTAIKEMHRQVGDLVFDEGGIALRGLLVRHLVLPGGLAGTEDVMRFLAQDISKETYVNIMDQYHPCGDVAWSSLLSRRITVREFQDAVGAASRAGLTRFDKRDRFRIVF